MITERVRIRKEVGALHAVMGGWFVCERVIEIIEDRPNKPEGVR